MKRGIASLIALTLWTSTFAAQQTPDVTPAPIKNEPPYMQNMICGELLAGLFRTTGELYRMTGRPGIREASLLAGTRATLFVKANAGLTADERKRARKIASAIERSGTPAKPALAPYQFCEQRAQRWLKEGVVPTAEMKQIDVEVRAAMDKLYPVIPPKL